MLAYILALAVGIGSVGLYMSAFVLPEVHRKNDIIWSGVGLFYALVLWVCARRISGGVLLGQIASVSLLGWFAWQTLMLRRDALPEAQQTPLPTQAEIKQYVQQQVDKVTKGQSTNGTSGTLTQLRQGAVGLLDGVTATIEQTIAKFKKTPVPPVTPTVSPKTPGAATKAVVAEAPSATVPPVTPIPEVEPKATPVDSVSPPPAVTEAPSAIAPPVPEIEPKATPVDFVSSVEVETPSVADSLPGQETQFQSPTDEQIEAAIQKAESDID